MSRVSYSSFQFGPKFIVALLIGMFAFGIVFLFWLPSRTGEGPGLWFGVIWMLALAWNAYWYFLRLSHRIELSDGRIRWFTPLRSGDFALDDLVSVRSGSLLGRVVVFTAADGQKVMMLARRGVTQFVDEVKAQSPGVEVRLVEPLMGAGRWNGFDRSRAHE